MRFLKGMHDSVNDIQFILKMIFRNLVNSKGSALFLKSESKNAQTIWTY